MTACAAQGPPTPPRIEKPARVTDLAVRQIGRTLELSFTPPALASDGERLSKPMEIEIYRNIGVHGVKRPVIAGNEVPWATLQPDEWMTLLKSQNPGTPVPRAGGQEGRSNTPLRSLGRRSEASSSGDGKGQARAPGPSGLVRRKRRTKGNAGNHAIEGATLVYNDALSEQEFRQSREATVVFAVRGLTRGFRARPIEADLSNIASATLLDVSPPVQGVSADQPAENAVELHWSAPTRTMTGERASGLAGYRVYKRATGQSGSFEPLGETKDTRFLDRDFQFDQTCYYRVRALFIEKDQVAESPDSAEVQFTPRDTFPPAPPSGLTAIYTNGAVELIWAANREPDLSGYNVYRRTDSRPPQRINSAPVGMPAFRDVSIEIPRVYDYWVTAVDQKHNESSASPPVRVETR